MKKSALLVAALAFGATTAFAQLESKKGEPYLPEAGDWAIGVDATPFLSYFGNMLNGGSNGSFNWGYTNSGAMITGKMFSTETMAYRAALRIGFGSNTWTEPIALQTSTVTPTDMTEDKLKQSWNFIGIGAGIEMRRGKTRLQGYYGGNLVFWMNGQKDVFTYGNDMNTTYPNPNSTDFQPIANLSYSNVMPARVTENKYGSEIGFGLRGFIGAEYFILPKISLGGEFGWGLGFSKTGASTKTTQAMNAGALETTNTDGGSSSSFRIDVDNNPMGIGSSGAILIHFHF